MKLNNKIALVTGGSSGLGFATAKRFIQEGAFVFIIGRRQEQLDKAAQELGPNARGMQADVSKPADLDRVVAEIAKKGKLDIVFANAGGGSFTPLGAITEEIFDKEFGINVKGMVFTVQKALSVMKDGGSIVLTSSIAGSQGTPAFSVYAATKAAIRSFARGWTTDLKDRRIRVNAVSPGVVPTEAYSTELKLSRDQIDAFAKDSAAKIPLGRVGTPDDIAKAVVFLASDDASWITGIELTVDGGMTQV